MFEEFYCFLKKKYDAEEAEKITWLLAWGLAGGLAGGLAWGLAGGLAGGLAWGLGFFQSSLISIAILSPPIPILYTVIAIILLAEILFWLSKAKPSKKENKFHFTVKRKTIALIESSYIILQIEGLPKAIQILSKWIGLNEKIVREIICFVGWGTITILAIAVIGYGWIKINEIKYKKNNKKKVNKGE
jgi:hypothetical protein